MSDILDGERWRVVRGECLRELVALPDGCVDAVVTDPPYSSGGAFRGDRVQSTTDKYLSTGSKGRETLGAFAGDSRDQRSFGFWVSLWAAELVRVAKPGAILAAFVDWRQLATLSDAVQAGGWILRGVAVWDKGLGTRPRIGGFRSQAEFIVWASNGPMADRPGAGTIPGVLHCPGVKGGKRKHQTQKPDGLMGEVVRVCPEGGIVLDPFCGSGSTGVAAIGGGCRFLGFEMTAHYAEIARERLIEAEAAPRWRPLESEAQEMAQKGELSDA